MGVAGTTAKRSTALEQNATAMTPQSAGSEETVTPTNRDRK